jgi:hypothetical protein
VTVPAHPLDEEGRSSEADATECAVVKSAIDDHDRADDLLTGGRDFPENRIQARDPKVTVGDAPCPAESKDCWTVNFAAYEYVALDAMVVHGNKIEDADQATLAQFVISIEQFTPPSS